MQTLSQQHPLPWLQLLVTDPAVHTVWVWHQALAVHLHQAGKILPALCLPGLAIRIQYTHTHTPLRIHVHVHVHTHLSGLQLLVVVLAGC